MLIIDFLRCVYVILGLLLKVSIIWVFFVSYVQLIWSVDCYSDW